MPDYIEQNRRARYLMKLAELDGRYESGHPQHGTFTGLYMARLRLLVDRDMALLLDGTPQLPECHPAQGGRKAA